MSNGGQLLVTDFLCNWVGIADIEAAEQFATIMLTAHNREANLEECTACRCVVFRWFDIGLVDLHRVPTFWDWVSAACVRCDFVCVEIELCHLKIP